MEVIIALLGISIGLFIGYKLQYISGKVRDLLSKEEIKPFVTNPYIEAKPYNTSNAIVTPKSPQQLQQEAFEKAKRGEL